MTQCNRWQLSHSCHFVRNAGPSAVCLVKCRFPSIYSTSRIQLLKSDLSDYDKILIDGEVQDITRVTKL